MVGWPLRLLDRMARMVRMSLEVAQRVSWTPRF